MEESEKIEDNQEVSDETVQKVTAAEVVQEKPPETNGVDDHTVKIKELEDKLESSLDKINKQADFIKLLEQRSVNVSRTIKLCKTRPTKNHKIS
jgi:hypothetical protein